MHVFDFEKPIYELEKKIDEFNADYAISSDDELFQKISSMQDKLTELKKEIYLRMSSWEKTQIARHPNRIGSEYFFKEACSDFMTLSGDRHFGDDSSILSGFGKINGEAFMMIGHQKGKSIQENVERNFGMPHPEGYRKALRLMRTAENFGVPILTLIDTPGAYPGIGAEERNQSEAIAYNLQEMFDLRVPVIAVVTGEGGSGGALALGVANSVLMLEHSIYSVISPEGCASILWSDGQKAKDAAKALNYSAQNLLSLGIIDEIIQEPLGGAHQDLNTTSENMKSSILEHLKKLQKLSEQEITEHRYKKFRNMGVFSE